VRDLRDRIKTTRIRRVASTRLVAGSAMAMRRGASLGEVQKRYFQSWSADELTKAGSAAGGN
jgi:hypothetical protein